MTDTAATGTVGTGTAAPRAGRRTAWLAAAWLGAVLVVIPAAWQAWTYANTRQGSTSGSSAGRPVTALEIVAGGYDVTVTPRADRQVSYRADLGWSFRRPTIEESLLGDTLRLTPHCPGGTGDSGLPGLGCSVRLFVTVPADIPIKVTAGSGRVDIGGLGGAVDADVDSGALHLTGLRGPVRARVGSGQLDATALTSPRAELRVGSGRATAAFLTPPEQVTARAGSGRVDLIFPTATRFRVDCEAGVGRCEVDGALRDPAASGTLTLSAASGRAHAGYAGAPDPSAPEEPSTPDR
ncbi:hypothetical protein ACQEVM_20645 [Streptomyces sp. CA-243310]|uniref:hypothetical protein n=1 Tax=Streptomyces sp. CA-243310 TaxID=3240056 RepID=UPI003D941E99